MDDFQLIREAYAKWFFETGKLNETFQNLIQNDPGNGEDLGDFVEAIATMQSFGPNPLAWDPPIRPEDL